MSTFRYLGPYLRLEIPTNITRVDNCRDKENCPNPPADKKFCSRCGIETSKRWTESLRERPKLPDILVDDLKEALATGPNEVSDDSETIDFCLIPNHHRNPPREFHIEDHTPYWIDLPDFAPEKEIEWLEKAFKEEIDHLEKAYDKIDFGWGFLQWFE